MDRALPPDTRDESAPQAANDITQISGSDRRTLEAIFRHPLSHGLSWREVVLLINAIGSAEERHNGEFMLSVGQERMPMRRPHNKDLTAPEVMDLRHFLARAGWAPDAKAKAEAPAAPEPTRFIVVIDHDGAKVCQIDPDLGPRHLLHHRESRAPDADRNETYPDDDHFFEEVAAAVSSGGEIVVIGHGKGQSNEADHLGGYLKVHHKDAYARIVRTLGADLPHLSLAELVELGRRAFAPEAVIDPG
jgi:hypothetical protein